MQKNNTMEGKLDKMIYLLRHLLALELYKGGATQEDIKKNLHINKSTVVKMLSGVKKDKSN